MNWKSRYFGTRAAIRAYVAFLILASLVTLAMLTEGFFAWFEAFRYLTPFMLIGMVKLTAEPGAPAGLAQMAGLGTIGTVAGVGLLGLAASVAYLLTGFGVLKQRAWTRQMSILLAVDIIAWCCFGLWVYGTHKLGVLEYMGMALGFATLVGYAVDKNIRAELDQNHRPMGGGPKVLLASYTFVIAVKMLSAPLFIGFIYTTHGDLMRALNVRPKHVRYELSDSDFIVKQCSKCEVFGYSMHLPRDMVIVAAIRARERGSWSMWLRNASAESSSQTPVFALDEESEYAGSENGEFFKLVFGIENAYDRDRRMSYPTWNPILLSMKAMGGPAEIVEDVSSPGWRGFVRVRSHTWRDSVVTDGFRCTAYSLKDRSSANVDISLTRRGSAVHSHVRDMLATLEFSAEEREAGEWSEKGIAALSDERYTEASIAFLNAFYRDDANSQYAYLFAKSLYDDPRETFRKSRLGTSVNFLRDALELDSAHVEARELLSRIESEYEALKGKDVGQGDSVD